MLTATLRWRNQFKVNEVVKEEFPDEVFGNLGYVYGHDRSGRPVACVLLSVCCVNTLRLISIIRYNLYGANQDLKAVFGDVQRFLRYNVLVLQWDHSSWYCCCEGGAWNWWNKVSKSSISKTLIRWSRCMVCSLRLLSYHSDLVFRSNVDNMLITNLISWDVDYQGVSLTNRDANSKNAASEATSIFQNHYPEFLVSFTILASVPATHPNWHELNI